MIWRLTHKGDRAALAIADRHYPPKREGRRQFTRPGELLVFVAAQGRALWTVHRQKTVRHAFPGTWECTSFRNETPHLLRSSDLIRAALAATRAEWGDPPEAGVLTFVTPSKIRSRLFAREPGYCFRVVGFEERARVPAGHGRPAKVALVLPAALVPPPCPALRAQEALAL